MAKTPLLIRHKQPNALGDVVLMTALIRDIHLAYPGKYLISASSNFSNVWFNNPYIVDKAQNTQAKPVDIGWGRAIRSHGYTDWPQGRTQRHILAWYHQVFFEQTKIKVPVTDPWADLHLGSDELEPIVQGRYWVIVAGGKSDVTVKHWRLDRAQEVVDKLLEKGIRCVQVGAVGRMHMHNGLENVIDLLGKTPNARTMWNIVKYADGVICGVTGPMHIAAAFEKPCVVYAGGREDPWFEAYVNDYKAFGPEANPVRVPHRFLHAIGKLSCCQEFGCWAARTIPLGDQLEEKPGKPKKYYKMCQKPVQIQGSEAVAACQDLITTEQVVNAVLSYYSDGTLRPVDGSIPVFNEAALPPVPPPAPPVVKKRLVKVVRGDHEAGTRRPAPVAALPLPPAPPPAPRRPTLAVKLPMLNALARVPVPELANPRFGGKITVFVLCYGGYPLLAKQCIGSILRTVPPEVLDLRVGTNESVSETIDFLYTTPATKIYVHETNSFKYPVMREMFYDPDHPIETKYLLWFDDDTWVQRSDWLKQLCSLILATPEEKADMFGTPMFHDTRMFMKNGHEPRKWFEEAEWYKNRPLRARNGYAPGGRGTAIDFAVGWHWALRTEAMRAANIPDTRLQHNGGDITIGEQLHQAGFTLNSWNQGKMYVACPAKADGGRRGFSQAFPWSPRT